MGDESTITKVSPTQFRKLLVKIYFSSRKSVIAFGPPGCGKSMSVLDASKEIAARLRKELVIYDDDKADAILREPSRYFVFVDLRLTELDPADLIGIPRTDGDYVTYKPLLWSRVLNRTSGILFLDEITNADDDVLKPAYKLLLERRAGFISFSNDVLVVAAGNTPEHSSIARELPLPILNRCLVLHIKEPSVEEWLEYMNNYTNSLHPRVAAYLMMFKSDLLKVPQHSEHFNNFPTPRSWTMLCETLSSEFSNDELLSVCVGFLGEEVGRKLYAFLMKQVPSIEEMLENPELFKSLELDQQYIFTVLLGRHLRDNLKLVDDAKYQKLLITILETLEEYAIVLFHAASEARFQLAIRIAQRLPQFRSLFRKIRELREHAA